MNVFNKVYINSIEDIINNGEKVLNERTGINIFQKFGIGFKWDMNYLPLLTVRQMYPKTALAELAWMIKGEKKLDFLQEYTNIWNHFADENNEVSSAYGYRWKHSFGVDQLQNIINKLREDKSNRQQVLMNWDARVDNVKSQKNVPCPYSGVFSIVNDKLNFHLSVRSNDMVIGFPYDILTYTLLSKAVANSVGVEVGEIFYTISNAHIYENHLDNLTFLNNSSYKNIFIINNNIWSVNDIINDSHGYVEDVNNLILNQGYKNVYGNLKLKNECKN